MTQINPYLFFNGNCREAMTFYRQALGGELIIQTLGESPVAAQFPPEMADRVMHASLTNDRIVLMASDDLGKETAPAGNLITLSLNSTDEQVIITSFARLSQGGTVKQPLKVEFWGALYGQLTDKYGINWMVNCDTQSAK